ncbi:MAG: lipoyl(octanoyl) transferase LipB [Bacteriovoracia bacterium]
MLKPKFDLNQFGLNEDDLVNLDDRTVVVTKFNWDYSLSHQFQRRALELVQETPHLRILICCNHPEVLTHGRGLQKPRKGEELNLKDFNPESHQKLPYPFFQIERGGGLTFHHPGQFIFYPILKLNPKSLSLSLMTDQIFDFSIDVLSDWGLKGLHHEHKLLGLWNENQKLASMGIAIEKLTTFHGMALNIIGNQNMLSAMRQLNPCGLDANTYSSVDAFIRLPHNPLERFREEFLKRISHEWK